MTHVILYHGVIDYNTNTTKKLSEANFNLIDFINRPPSELYIIGLFYNIGTEAIPICLDNLMSYLFKPILHNDNKYYIPLNLNKIYYTNDRNLYYNPRYDNEEYTLKIFQKYNLDIGLLSSPSANLARPITGKVYRRIPQFNTTENIFTKNEAIITRLYTLNKI